MKDINDFVSKMYQFYPCQLKAPTVFKFSNVLMKGKQYELLSKIN